MKKLVSTIAVAILFAATTSRAEEIQHKVLYGETYVYSDSVAAYTDMPGVWVKANTTEPTSITYEKNATELSICGVKVLALGAASCTKLITYNKLVKPKG